MPLVVKLWEASLNTRQLGPRCERQLTLMAEPNRQSFRSLVHTRDISSPGSTDRRTGTNRTCDRTRTLLAHHFYAVCGDGSAVCRGPRTTSSFGPQRELPPARLAIHRQTSVRAQREETLEVQPRSGILALFFPLQRLAADNGRAPHYQRATWRLLLGREVATLLSTGFWAWNH